MIVVALQNQAIADAQFYEAQKVAEATLLKGQAEAQALELKAEAMKKYGEAAMLEMVVSRLPEVARAIGEPLAQTEKIILFGEGAATGLIGPKGLQIADIDGGLLLVADSGVERERLDVAGGAAGVGDQEEPATSRRSRSTP